MTRREIKRIRDCLETLRLLPDSCDHLFYYYNYTIAVICGKVGHVIEYESDIGFLYCINCRNYDDFLEAIKYD